MPAEAALLEPAEQRRRRAQWIVAVASLLLLFYLVRMVLYARTWPLVVHDSAIMHYVSFMIQSGRAPYLSEIEMNLPGALMSEWFSMHVFGGDALGLWRWDTFVGLLGVIGGAWAAPRGYRIAGAAGAMLAWALHLNDSAFGFGERDWLVAALALLAVACTGEAVERKDPRWMAGCFALAGWCCAIKPFALELPVLLLLFALWKLRTQWRAVLLWTVVGGLLPTAATVLYFAHWPGAFTAFLYTEHTIGAWYGTLKHATWQWMIFGVFNYPLLLFCALVLYLLLREGVWRRTREALLALCALSGLCMYVVQHKGFPYHIYPLMLPTAVLGFVLAQRGLAGFEPRAPRRWDMAVAAIVLVLLGCWRLPRSYWKRHVDRTYPYATQEALIADLNALGGHALTGKIQCLDMTLGGCIGALYDLRLVQTTGFVNDHLLFPQKPTSLLAEYQQRFLHDMQQNPPQVIVLSAHNWPDDEDHTFDKLPRWPEFGAWMLANYRLDHTHLSTTREYTASYQIYVHR